MNAAATTPDTKSLNIHPSEYWYRDAFPLPRLQHGLCSTNREGWLSAG